MNKQQLERYIRRCQRHGFDEIDEETPYEWKASGTLIIDGDFRPGTPGDRVFYHWLAEITKPVSPRFLNWFAVFEYDQYRSDPRIHVLVGGSGISFRQRWNTCWHDKSGGSATLSVYRGDFGARVIRETYSDYSFEVDMDLSGWGLWEFECHRCG